MSDDSLAIYLVCGSVLSLSFVEPHTPERPDQPVSATRRERRMARPSPIEPGCRAIPPDPSEVCRWPHA